MILRLLADLQMEYEDVLPYSEFAIRLPQHAIYRLPAVLQEVMDTPGKVQENILHDSILQIVLNLASWRLLMLCKACQQR